MATDDGKVGQRGAPPWSWVVDRRQAGSVGVAEEEGDAEADTEGGRGGGNGGSRVSDDVAWTAGAVMHCF
jgi:hypothetical protein